MKYNYFFPQLKRDCLIIDIETWAEFSNGQEINIGYQFENYVDCAQIKWFGAYSYARNAYYILEVKKNKGFIINLLNTHNTIIGFNSQEFDYPILKNNGYIINERKRPVHIDCMQILGKSVFSNRDGYAYKNRGELMDYKFKNNSLKTMAEEMKLDFQKGDIDYHIFKKDSWTPEEETQIKNYLKNDILITKQMFEKLWNFWVPFTELLNLKFVKDFSWIRSSIASLTYKAACSYLGVEPTYSEEVRKEEKMGGNVLLPKYEEARNVWYVDFASLYPHLMCMFNLLAEKDPKDNPKLWHGNEMFKVRGYYDISKPHPLNMQIQKKLSERIQLKKLDKNNPMIYALKIFLNGLYGVVRSPIFEKIHTPNAGWDTCYLGQQVQGYVSKRMLEFGFESIAGDTDSLFLLTKDESKNKKEYVRECLTTIVKEINKNTPFPVGTFDINIETFIEYIMFPFSEEPIEDAEGNNIKENNKLVKEYKGKKKNYIYIHQNGEKKDVVLVGLPVKKENATSLGIKIFTEVLEPLILKQMHAKFSYDFMKETINTYLKQDKILELIAQEYKIKPLSTYKLESQIQAQISKAYFNGQEGIISLIKNKKVGKVGKGTKYCSIEEAKEAKLTEEDLDLKKLWNELIPFIDRNTLPKKEMHLKKSKQPKTNDEVMEEAKELMQDCMDDKVDKIIEDRNPIVQEEAPKKIVRIESKPVSNTKEIKMKKILEPKLNLSPTELVLRRIYFDESSAFVKVHHYSHSLPMNTKISYGFYYTNDLKVVITFGTPIGRSVIQWLQVPQGSCLELTRVASLDAMPKNTESYCIGQALKQLKKDLPEINYLISYADTNEGHCGYIYQASNWKYIGLQPQIMIAERFFIDGKEIHSRNLNNMHQTTNMEVLTKIYGNRIEKTYGVKKHIYIYCLGNKKECKDWYSKFTFLPYPKAHNDIIIGKYKNDSH